LINLEKPQSDKVEKLLFIDKCCFDDKIPSPDCSGNPFLLGLREPQPDKTSGKKDCNGKREIAPKKQVGELVSIESW
jgi:hypothetical protein